MSEESTRRALSPPSITDASDNDAPDEVLQLLGSEKKTNWPSIDVDVAALDKLFSYGLRLSRNKVLKAVALAIIAGISAIAYTYILLSVR